MSQKRNTNTNANTKTSRRQFLQGQSAIEAITELADRAASANQPASSVASDKSAADRSYLFHLSRAAMACQFQVILGAGQPEGAAEAAVETLDLVESLEDQMTVYRDESELSQINRQAAAAPVPVEPQLFELLQRAIRLHRETHGAFDITAGPLVKTWGFYRRQGRLPTPEQLQQALQIVGSERVELDAEQKSVRFSRDGVEMNLGGIGKGYALDRCAEHLQAAGVVNFLLHGGQSSVLAGGSRSGEADHVHGWLVGVRHPLRPERRLAQVRLHNRSLGTSGSGTQYFHHQGRRYGHILDPRTGWPADGVLSATVIAPRAADADALATAFYVLGADVARLECCRTRPELGAILVCPGANVGTVEVRSVGLEDTQWTCENA